MHSFLPVQTEAHSFVVGTARDFTQKHLLPGVIARDEEQSFHKEGVKELASLGFMGMMVDPAYGGSGMDMVSYVLALMEISKVDASIATCMAVHNALVCAPLQRYGTERQKKKYLTWLSKGEMLGAFCLSEPGSGTEASIQTTAVLQADSYVLNGTKTWVTNGNSASLYLVFAQSDPKKKRAGVSAFLVARNSNGLHIGKKENKMGIRGSDTHTVMFSDVQVPKDNLLGEEGQGFYMAMHSLIGGRIGIAAQATGIATGAYELALAYAKERKSFGKYIAEHQAIQFKLANMATQVEVARLLTLEAAAIKDAGKNDVKSASSAKLYASQIAQDVTGEAVQIHGGYGYVKEFHVERLMRDAKITQIYEGTSEVQRMLIAKHILE